MLRYSLPGPHSKWQIYPHNPSELGAPRPATAYQAPTPSGRYTHITRRSMALRASQTRVSNISPLTRGNLVQSGSWGHTQTRESIKHSSMAPSANFVRMFRAFRVSVTKDNHLNIPPTCSSSVIVFLQPTVQFLWYVADERGFFNLTNYYIKEINMKNCQRMSNTCESWRKTKLLFNWGLICCWI